MKRPIALPQVLLTVFALSCIAPHVTARQPNILFIFSDDHALNAISAYGGRLAEVAPTPNIDRIANEGALFRNSFCANSICGPSRACILTGKHSHKNGFLRNTGTGFDQSQWTVAKSLKRGGYQTAVIGKWHLKTDPVAFDHWDILPGQGSYYNPVFISMDGKQRKFEGYATDITTDKAIEWLDQRDAEKPFLLMCQHKAPHRTFSPALRHLGALDGVTIPEPDNLFDDYATRSKTLPTNEMEIDRHMTWAYDLKLRKEEMQGVTLPEFRSYGTPEYNRMTPEQKAQWDAHFAPKNKAFIDEYKTGSIDHRALVRWKYQRYMQNYLETVKAVDESVGRLLEYLDDHQLADNTVVIYSSDQGFYLGEHGWFDKRWMFEESFTMPFVIRWPGVIDPGSKPTALIQNIDYAPTFLDMAGLETPDEVQGKSIVPVLRDSEQQIRDALYYAYYELGEHAVPQHFGVRTHRHKLFYLPWTDEWQLFDLVNDPAEMRNVYADPGYADVRKTLHQTYDHLRSLYDAPSYEKYAPPRKRQ
ncbi:Arylsulfatase [Stieleria maiorica]|uniref:Arylsulfatase n=1 Tax=Stieleria maiorica TaxID=2795974 RepID=A0A5B9MGB5_9BACT|nr:sulfatase [Stieleria maiorica]QEG00313.1 Arylsulfatase [Stieleria maiorica]